MLDMDQPDTAPKVEQPTAVELPKLVERAVVASGGEPPTLQLFIAGEWRSAASGDTFEIRSPIDGNEIAVAQAAGDDDVEAAIDAAFAAPSSFRAMTAAERIEICERAAEIMSEHFDALVHTIVVELRKKPSQAK